MSVFVLVIAAHAAQSPAGLKAELLFGAYQDCPFHCRTILIRPDHTFVYRLDGDLYNNERFTGTWEYLEKNKLRATSPRDTTPPRVRESADASSMAFAIVVTDEQGAVIQGAQIAPVGLDSASGVETDASGEARLPACDELEVSYASYSGRFRPSAQSFNVFEVTLSAKQLSTWAIDDVWLIDGGELFIEQRDGTFDLQQGLKKLSKAREDAIFHTAPPN